LAVFPYIFSATFRSHVTKGNRLAISMIIAGLQTVDSFSSKLFVFTS